MMLLQRLKESLEKPRSQRPLGSGWLSGAGSVLAGITGLLLAVILHYPGWFTTPELSFVHNPAILHPLLHFVLLLGYVFALISLLLSRDKFLASFGLFITVISAIYAGAQTQPEAGHQSLYFGLDFFILNLLFTGFLFIPLERIFPARAEQTVFRQEWREDMFYYFVSSLMVQILAFLTLAPSNFVNSGFDLTDIRSQISALPFVVQVIVIMIATDFIQYWLHRTFHRIPFLWRFHAVHHSAEKMDWLAGARMHFLEIIVLRSVTALPMFTLGFHPGAIQAYILIVYFFSSFVHANIGWNLKIFERFLVTPRFHHWHHGIEKEAIDVNFSIHFPLYDWLFGTYHMPENRWPSGYGVATEPVPRGYIKQFLHPFTRKKEYAEVTTDEKTTSKTAATPD